MFSHLVQYKFLGAERDPDIAANSPPGLDGDVLQQAARNLSQAFTGDHSRHPRKIRSPGHCAAVLHVGHAADDPKTGQKVEIVVENDSLQGDRDDIELSIHTYKNNEVQRTPFMPHLVFSMKIESGLWALNEISITIKLPLADPDLLKSIADGMKGRAAVASPQIHVQGAGLVPGQNSIMTMGSATMGSDANALADVRKFLPPRLFTRPPTPPSGTPALFLISMALALLSPTNTKLCSSVAGWRGAGIRDTRSRYQAAPTRRRPVFA